MSGLAIFVLVAFGLLLLIGLSNISSSSQGLGGGSKKGKFGVVGLVVALFAILGLSNYLQQSM